MDSDGMRRCCRDQPPSNDDSWVARKNKVAVCNRVPRPNVTAFSESFTDRLLHFEALFSEFKKTDLMPQKSCMRTKETRYVGFLVLAKGVRPVLRGLLSLVAFLSQKT